MTKLKNDIDKGVLKDAINNTFTNRESFEYLRDYEKIIDSIIDSERIKSLWNSYSIKNNYAKNIEVDQIAFLLKDFIKELDLEIVGV